MSVDAKVIERIKKLLALAGNNPNEHEAASAAARAQELMQEHDLSMESVSTKVDARTAGIGRTDRTTLRERGKPGGWKVDIFRAVGDTSDCWVYIVGDVGRAQTGYLIGRKTDTELARYIFEFLVREIERLQQAFGATRWDELREYARFHGITTHDAERDFSSMGKHPLRAKDSWVRGAVESVVRSLYDAKRERTTSDRANALVVHKEAGIKDWWAQQNGYADWEDYRAKTSTPSTVVASKPPTKREMAKWEAARRRADRKEQTERNRLDRRTDWDALNQGLRDGKRIRVNPGVGHGDTHDHLPIAASGSRE